MKKFLKVMLILCMVLYISGCTNSSGTSDKGAYARANEAYNRKNQTSNRSLILDTLIASTLYNNPQIIPSFSKSKTKSKTTENVNSVSNTVADSQYFSDGNSSFGQNKSVTTTKTHSKSKTKSVTTGVGISPNLDYYLK